MKTKDALISSRPTRDKDGRRVGIAPILDESVYDCSFKDDVGCLRELLGKLASAIWTVKDKLTK